jgi:hypothetical protein
LDGVTVVCVDTLSPSAGFRALQRTADLLPGARRLFFCSDSSGLDDGRVSIRQIPQFRNVDEYSRFILTNLVDHIETSYALLVQWDGFALDADAWDDAFLDFDYIGAPWPQFAAPLNVGNGGFSLRSRRLMEALRDPRLTLHCPEDVCICRTNRAMLEDIYGLRFAPFEVAARFAYERGPMPAATFGFHGLFNFPQVMPQSYREEIMSLPPSLLAGRLRHSVSAVDRSLAYRIAARIAVRRPQHWWRLMRSFFGS